jgi:signal transduction histidine kinase
MLWTGVLIGFAAAVVVGLPVVWLELKRQTRRARAAERRARDAQRLADIGGMTGGLAHEIKNPLSTIGLNAQLLAESIAELRLDDADKGRLIRRIDALRREAERLRDILTDFLRFAGSVKLDLRRADVNAVVEEIVDFYLPQAQHHGIRLRAELAPGPMHAMLDPAHLKQAVLNLLINATQAMESTPAADHPAAAREIILRTAPGRTELGPAWELHVIDTGPGISAENLARIFTPYFTTKAAGSGIGLPTAKRLIDEHGGRIEVHSEPGRGTDFTIFLPRA